MIIPTQEAPTTPKLYLLLGTRSYKGLLASLLGARTLQEPPGRTTRRKKLLGWRPLLLVVFSCVLVVQDVVEVKEPQALKLRLC